jgi:hypothetical protein
MRARVRVFIFSGWQATFDGLDLDLTEEDVLRDLVSFPTFDDPTIEVPIGVSV